MPLNPQLRSRKYFETNICRQYNHSRKFSHTNWLITAQEWDWDRYREWNWEQWVLLYRNIHTGPVVWDKEGNPGPIDSYCAGPLPCPGPFRVSCKEAKKTFFISRRRRDRTFLMQNTDGQTMFRLRLKRWWPSNLQRKHTVTFPVNKVDKNRRQVLLMIRETTFLDRLVTGWINSQRPPGVVSV